MNDMFRSRKPKGVSDGGQFVAERHDEAPGRLGDVVTYNPPGPQLADRSKAELDLAVQRSEHDSDEVLIDLRRRLVGLHEVADPDTYETLRVTRAALNKLYDSEQRFFDDLERVRAKLLGQDRERDSEHDFDPERGDRRIALWNQWQTELQIGFVQSRDAIAGTVEAVDRSVVDSDLRDPGVLTGIAWAHLTRRNATVASIVDRIGTHVDRFAARPNPLRAG